MIDFSGRTLRRGQSLEGYLLAFDGDPIPDSFRHGTDVPVVLTLIDQFDEAHPTELFLRVNRKAEQEPKPAPCPRRNLLKYRDKKPKQSSKSAVKIISENDSRSNLKEMEKAARKMMHDLRRRSHQRAKKPDVKARQEVVYQGKP